MGIMQFRQNLPAKTSELWRNIENTIGENKILLLENTEALDKTNAKPLALKCHVFGGGAIILYRNEIDINICELTHELLHIHRYLVQGIPMLMPKNTKDIPITSDIETTLEHLVIVPEEVEYGYDPYSDQAYMEKFNWQNFPEKQGDFTMQLNCLLGWLRTKNLTKKPEVITLAEKSLRKLNSNLNSSLKK